MTRSLSKHCLSLKTRKYLRCKILMNNGIKINNILCARCSEFSYDFPLSVFIFFQVQYVLMIKFLVLTRCDIGRFLRAKNTNTYRNSYLHIKHWNCPFSSSANPKSSNLIGFSKVIVTPSSSARAVKADICELSTITVPTILSSILLSVVTGN